MCLLGVCKREVQQVPPRGARSPLVGMTTQSTARGERDCVASEVSPLRGSHIFPTITPVLRGCYETPCRDDCERSFCSTLPTARVVQTRSEVEYAAEFWPVCSHRSHGTTSFVTASYDRG